MNPKILISSGAISVTVTRSHWPLASPKRSKPLIPLKKKVTTSPHPLHPLHPSPPHPSLPHPTLPYPPPSSPARAFTGSGTFQVAQKRRKKTRININIHYWCGFEPKRTFPSSPFPLQPFHPLPLQPFHPLPLQPFDPPTLNTTNTGTPGWRQTRYRVLSTSS